jgi:hypothetical protein
LAPVERNTDDVFEIEINCIGSDRVGESIERFLQREFKLSKNSYDFVDSFLVHQATRSPDKQLIVFIELDVRR